MNAVAVSFCLLFLITGCSVEGTAPSETNIEDTVETEDNTSKEDTLKTDAEQENAGNPESEAVKPEEESPFDGYRLIQVDGGNQSGHREANVVVDIGYGDREYWAFTNEYGQLVKVIAKEIVLQDDANEPVTSDGRYYSDEAKVPGVEDLDLDEGHVIADSLGGVSNAYNITPQNSTLNRHGDQAYMEKVIRDAGGCTDFVAIITYPNTSTQIPSHYSYTYTLRGNVINDEFDNVNPDDTYDTGSSGKNISSSATPDNSVVYWTPNGKSYHTTRNCPTLSRSKTILEGSVAESGKTDPCDRCH